MNRYQNQELEIYRQLRMDQTPYTCATIGGEEGLSNREEQEGTDVEHIVALAEAHDSGLSADDMVTFSGDPFNLTVAMPYENRTVKSDRGRGRLPARAQPVLVRGPRHRRQAAMGPVRG